MNKTKRVGIYLRVSTEEQARLQDGSLISQKQRLIEYVDAQNRREADWGTVIDFYCDEGKSGKDMRRTQFQRLLSDVKSGRVNLILATELSRLSRSIKDFCELWDLFRKHNTGFITLREQFDTTSAAGELMVFNLINFSQFERKQTAERISANFEARAKRGLWNGGPIPFGFDKNPNKKGELVPHPIESKQIKDIFELFLEIGSVRKTCLELKSRGIFTKRYTNKHGTEKGARQITITSLQKILTNESYIGLRAYGKIGSRKLEVVKACWEPIIELDLFNRAQAKLHTNKNKYKPDEWKRYPFPLTELIFCGECGKNLGGKSATSENGTKHFYYEHARQLHSDGVNHLKRCRLERVKAEKIETIVLRSLQTLASDPATLDHWLDIYAKGTQSGLPSMQGRIKSIESDILTLERRNKNLVERLSELPSEVSAEPLYGQIKENSDKAIELRKTRQSLQTEEMRAITQSVDRESLLFRIKRTVQNLEKAPIEQRRGIYANLIKFAELHPTKVKLGVYAPVKSESKNDKGAAAFAAGPGRFSNSMVSGFKVASSTTVSNGGPCPT
jgi:DNA invertase Pin-like site-specific DNA recombinase